MTSPWLYVLTVGPLGFYLWVLALWQSDRSPRVVRGLVDFGWLAFGVGGFLAFGPFGQLLARVVSPRPDFYDRMVVVSGLGLGACLLAHRSLRRLVVYHVDADQLAPAVEDVLRRTGGRYVRTISGFEDASASRGLRVDSTRWLGCAVLEAYGADPDGLIQEVRPLLVARLRGATTRASRVALGLYAGSVLVMLVPLLGVLLNQPRAREVLRVLLERLRGG